MEYTLRECRQIRGKPHDSGVYSKVVKTADYAIKRYKSKQRPSSDFLLELSILQTIKHKNIVDIHNIVFNTRNNEYALELELADTSLHELIKAECTENDKITIIRDILYALETLHSKSILHGDIKPDNILIFHSPLRAKLCDFGLSITNISIASQWTNITLFAENYRAPESIISTALDIYAFGKVVYDLITMTQNTPSISHSYHNYIKPINNENILIDIYTRCTFTEYQQRPSASDLIKEEIFHLSSTDIINKNEDNVYKVKERNNEDNLYKVIKEIIPSEISNLLSIAIEYANRINEEVKSKYSHQVIAQHIIYISTCIIGPLDWYPPDDWNIDYCDPVSSNIAHNILKSMNFNLSLAL